MEAFRAGWRSACLPKWKTWELEKPPERSHECLLHRKEEKEDNVSKTIFPRIKKKELECQRKAMLCVFLTGPYVYVHICIWIYVHGLCCCGRFSITCTAVRPEGWGSKLLGSWRSRSPALLLWGPAGTCAKAAGSNLGTPGKFSQSQIWAPVWPGKSGIFPRAELFQVVSNLWNGLAMPPRPLAGLGHVGSS